MIVIGATMKNKIGAALRSLLRLTSFHIRSDLFFLPNPTFPPQAQLEALPLLETVGAVARPISVYLQLFARQSRSTKGSLRFKW